MTTNQEGIYKGSKVFLEALELAITALDNTIEVGQNAAHNHAVSRLLKDITQDGKVHPHFIPYSSNALGLQREIEENLRRYNKAHPKEKIPYYINHTSGGGFEFWTNDAGEKKIHEIERSIRISKGGYFAEVTPSELFSTYEDKTLTKIEGLTNAEVEMLKRRPYPINNDFSFCTTFPKENTDTPTIYVPAKKFMTNLPHDKNSLVKEDVFTCMVRSRVALNDKHYGELLKSQVEYDKNFEKYISNFESNKTEKESAFIASAKGGGKYYIEIKKDGYRVFENNVDVGDYQQLLKKEVPLSPLAASDSPEKMTYLKTLFYDISQYIGDCPVLVDNDKECIQHYVSGEPISSYPLERDKKNIRTMEFKDNFTKEYCKEIKRLFGDVKTYMDLPDDKKKIAITNAVNIINHRIEHKELDNFSENFQKLLVQKETADISSFQISEISDEAIQVISDFTITQKSITVEDIRNAEKITADKLYYNRLNAKNEFNDALLKEINGNTISTLKNVDTYEL